MAKKFHIKRSGRPDHAKKQIHQPKGLRLAERAERRAAHPRPSSVLPGGNREAKLLRKLEHNKARDARRALTGGSPGVF